MKNLEMLGLIAFGGSIIALGYSMILHKKLKDTQDLVESTVDNIAEDLEIDIPQKLVDEAIKKAVTREVSKFVRQAADEAVRDVRRDILVEVTTLVAASVGETKKAVSTEIIKQVSNINIQDLKNEVKELAKDKILEKFDGNLDSLLSDFNQNLNNVSKIYKSIAENMSTK